MKVEIKTKAWKFFNLQTLIIRLMGFFGVQSLSSEGIQRFGFRVWDREFMTQSLSSSVWVPASEFWRSNLDTRGTEESDLLKNGTYWTAGKKLMAISSQWRDSRESGTPLLRVTLVEDPSKVWSRSFWVETLSGHFWMETFETVKECRSEWHSLSDSLKKLILFIKNFLPKTFYQKLASSKVT